MLTDPTPSQIIDALGGTAETAQLCEVSSPAVSQWRGQGIPKARLKFLRLARPDIFMDRSQASGNEAEVTHE
jgi:hypothetical protein